VICSHCKKQLGPEDRFCSRCGHALGDRAPQSGDKQPIRKVKSPGQSSAGRSKFLAFLMVAALGAAGYYYLWQSHTQKGQRLDSATVTAETFPPDNVPESPGFGGLVNVSDSTREPAEGYFVDQFENILQNEREMRRGTGYYDNSSPDEYIDVIIGRIRYKCRSEGGTNLPDSGAFSFDVQKDGTVSGSITLPELVTPMSGTLSPSGELTMHGKHETGDCEMSGNIDTRTTGTGFITGAGKFRLTDSGTGAVPRCEGEWATLE